VMSVARPERHARGEPTGRPRPKRRRLRVNGAKLLLAVILVYLGALLIYGEVQDLRLHHEVLRLQAAVRQKEADNARLRQAIAFFRSRDAAALLALQRLGLTKPGVVPVELVHTSR
jgi:cell division protein FtsB